MFLLNCGGGGNSSFKVVETQQDIIELGVAFGEGYKDEVFMPYIRELGAKLSEIKLSWEDLEPDPPAGGMHTYHFDVLDKFINQLNGSDVVLIAIFTTASWATDNAPEQGGPLKKDGDCLNYGMTCSHAYKDLIS